MWLLLEDFEMINVVYLNIVKTRGVGENRFVAITMCAKSMHAYDERKVA